MADTNVASLLKTLKEMLQCCICFDELNDPRQLHCGHTFCFRCLQNWSGGAENSFQCPTCRGRESYTVDSLRRDYRCEAIKETLVKFTIQDNFEFGKKPQDDQNSAFDKEDPTSIKFLIMIEKVNKAMKKWETNSNNLLEAKSQVLQALREETHKIIQLAALWSAKTESAVEKLFAEDVKELIEIFATSQTLVSALQQQISSIGNESKSQQHLGERVEYVCKVIDRNMLRRQQERVFVINPVNQMIAFTSFDQLTGICSQLEAKQQPLTISEIAKLKSTKVHGKFFITKAGKNLRLSDADLCAGTLVVSDIMNSCIYIYNSWTGRQIISTHDNPFQHGVQFPKQVLATSTGQICVTEQLKDKIIHSILQNKLLNKRMLSKSTFMDENQLFSNEIIGFEHLSEPSFQRYRSQTKEDTELFTPPSKDDLMIDLIKGTNAEVRLQNLTERKDHLLAVNYHRNKVFYMDKRNGSFWTVTLPVECGPRKATLGFSGDIIVCCSKAVHLHILNSEGIVLRPISLEKTGIQRPIAAHQRDDNHFLITEEQGACTTLRFL